MSPRISPREHLEQFVESDGHHGWQADHLRHGPHGQRENARRRAKSLGHRRLRTDNLNHAVVFKTQDGQAVPPEPRKRFLGQFPLARALGGKGQSHRGNDQGAGLLGLLGHDGRCSGTGATAESGTQEHDFNPFALGA